uniref:Uncharacterized protein n=1 Tax=Setaria digitata TaxID=48799 RepID=A0A915PIN4_9BILA
MIYLSLIVITTFYPTKPFVQKYLISVQTKYAKLNLLNQRFTKIAFKIRNCKCREESTQCATWTKKFVIKAVKNQATIDQLFPNMKSIQKDGDNGGDDLLSKQIQAISFPSFSSSFRRKDGRAKFLGKDLLKLPMNIINVVLSALYHVHKSSVQLFEIQI